MKPVTSFFMLGLMLVFVMGGCIKEPTREITDAQSAVEAAIQAGASIYTANEIKSLGDELTAAIDLAKSQTGKFLASNKKAKEKLLKIKRDADALKTTILAKKTEAKINAMIGLANAQAALKEAKNLLANPTKVLGTKADIEAITANITALEDSLPEIQAEIDGENYLYATEEAEKIKKKTMAISDQIKQAIEKANNRKKRK